MSVFSQILPPVFLALLVLPLGSFAQDLETQLKNCAVIQGRDERLECYDNLSDHQLQAQATQEVADQSSTGGEWQLTRETSPIDDSEIVYLSLAASESTPTSPVATAPTLFIRCKEKRLESFINWGGASWNSSRKCHDATGRWGS